MILFRTAIAFFLLAISFASFGQSKEEEAILREGNLLYRTEMASWYGTDIFLDKYADRRDRSGGYFSYIEGDNTVCIFFSRDEIPVVIGSFTFDSTFNVSTALVDGTERELSEKERRLIAIRQAARAEYVKDTATFKSYQNTSANFIPLDDERGRRVYVLTGPKQQGVVIFGNDYLLTFKRNGELDEKKRLHKNIIPIQYSENGSGIISMHSHLPESGDLITATDICTLKLYGKYARWGQHYVLSDKNVSVWDCQKEKLLVMSRKIWDQLAEEKKKRKIRGRAVEGAK